MGEGDGSQCGPGKVGPFVFGSCRTSRGEQHRQHSVALRRHPEIVADVGQPQLVRSARSSKTFRALSTDSIGYCGVGPLGARHP